MIQDFVIIKPGQYFLISITNHLQVFMLLLYYCFKITSSSYLIMYMYFWFFNVYKYIFVNCSYAHFIVHVIVATCIWMFIFLKQQTYLHILIPDYTNCYWCFFLMFYCFNKELYVVYSIFFWIPQKSNHLKVILCFCRKKIGPSSRCHILS